MVFPYDNYSIESGTFGGATFKVALAEVFPFLIFDNSSGENILKTGIDAKLLYTLAEALDFKIQVLTAVDNVWGAKDENGSWSGLIGMILRNETDMTLSDLDITEERNQVVSFTIPYFFSRLKIVMKKCDIAVSRSNMFFRAFNIKMWICIALCMIFATIFINLLCKFAPKMKNFNKPYWYICRSVLFQSLEKDVPNTSSSRIFQAFWLLFLFIVSCYFSSLLISHVSVPPNKRYVETLQDLIEWLEKGDFFMAFMQAGSTSEIFKFQSSSEQLNKLAAIMHDHLDWMCVTSPECSSRFLSGKWALFVTEMFAHYLAHQNNVSVHISDEALKCTYQGIAFRKGFPFMEMINKRIMSIFESGIIQKWTLDTYHELSLDYMLKNYGSEVNTENAYINLKDLMNTLALMLFGDVIAIFVLIIERTFYKV